MHTTGLCPRVLKLSGVCVVGVGVAGEAAGASDIVS